MFGPTTNSKAVGRPARSLDGEKWHPETHEEFQAQRDPLREPRSVPMIWASSPRPSYGFPGITPFIEQAANEGGPDGHFNLHQAAKIHHVKRIVDCMTWACQSPHPATRQAQIDRALQWLNALAVAQSAVTEALIVVSGELNLNISFTPRVPEQDSGQVVANEARSASPDA